MRVSRHTVSVVACVMMPGAVALASHPALAEEQTVPSPAGATPAEAGGAV